jgi:hypothetical protein
MHRPDLPPIAEGSANLRLRWQSIVSFPPARKAAPAIDVGGAAYTVIGVLPVKFRFPAESQPDLLRPFGLAPKPVWDTRKPLALLRVIGRLKPGISIGQASANIGLMNRQIVAQLPPPFARFYAGVRADVMPLDRQLVGNVRSYLLILLWIPGHRNRHSKMIVIAVPK